jgi:hypothetical protein
MKNEPAFKDLMNGVQKLVVDYQQYFTQQNIQSMERLISAINEFKAVISKSEERERKNLEKATV